VNEINSGNWEEILNSDDLKQFLQTGNDDFDDERKLKISIACLFEFLKHNFTGPNSKLDEENFRFSADGCDNKWKNESTCIDGIEMNANIKFVPLLIIAKNFIEDLNSKYPQGLVS
jgi:hypothetical protein